MAMDPGEVESDDTGEHPSGNPLLADLVDMPSVNEHVVNAESADNVEDSQTQAERAAPTEALDYKGRTFDPALHLVDGSGSPVIGPRNRLQLKKGVRTGQKAAKEARADKPQPRMPPKIVIPNADGTPGEAIDAPGSPTASATIAANPCDPAQAIASATVCMQLLTTIGKMIDSDEWEPKPEEKQNLTSAFQNYFLVRGSPDIPPEVLVIATVGAYAVPRLQLPKTSDKVARVKSAILMRFRTSQASRALDIRE